MEDTRRLYKTITSLPTKSDRNLIRGLLRDPKKASKRHLANSLRTTLRPAAQKRIVPLLFGPRGAYDASISLQDFAEACRNPNDSPASIDQNLAYLQAIIGAHTSRVTAILKDLGKLNLALLARPEDFVRQAHSFSEKYGASRSLLKKLAAFLRLRGHETNSVDAATLISILEKHRINTVASIYISACELMAPRAHPFEAAKTIAKKGVIRGTEATPTPSLLEEIIAPLPSNENKINDYLNTTCQLTLVDVCSRLMALQNHADAQGWPIGAKLPMKIIPALKEIRTEFFDHTISYADLSPLIRFGIPDLEIYCLAPALIELRQISIFRTRLDHELIPRLFDTHRGRPDIDIKSTRRDEWLRKITTEVAAEGASGDINSTTSERGYLQTTTNFLSFLATYPSFKSFSDLETAHLMTNTIGLSSLLTEHEVRALYLDATERGALLAALLWCAIWLDKNNTSDVEFELASIVEQHAEFKFHSDFFAVVDHLAAYGTKIVVFLEDLMSVRRLQRYYSLFETYDDVVTAKIYLLTTCGDLTRNFDYYINADQLRLEQRLGKIKTLLDESRIYIEELPFKKWAKDHTMVKLGEFSKYTTLISAEVPRPDLSLNISPGTAETRPIYDLVNILRRQLINEAVKEAFEAFCRDTFFGIDSFLGRRIRHNTLHTQMLGGIDAVFHRVSARHYGVSGMAWAAFQSWKKAYTARVDWLRESKIRFRVDGNRDGAFTWDLDEQSPEFIELATKLGSSALIGRIDEEIIPILLQGCWQFFEPQLRDVNQFLRIGFKQEILLMIDDYILLDEESRMLAELQVELREDVSDRIDHLATWFTPYNPLETTRSLEEVAQLAWAETASDGQSEMILSGEGCMHRASGAAVQTLFDCLFVLLKNASNYLRELDDPSLCVDIRPHHRRAGGAVVVSVSSTLRETNGGAEIYGRIESVLQTTEGLEAAMVNEGYSGLRKLMYILRRLGLSSSLQSDWDGETLTFSFDFMALPPGGDDAGSAD